VGRVREPTLKSTETIAYPSSRRGRAGKMIRLQKLAIAVVGLVILAFVMSRSPGDRRTGTSSSSITKIGQPIRVKNEVAGCFKDEDTYKIIRMAEQNDLVAFQKLLSSQACRPLRPEWTMYVDQVAFSDNICVRPRGWTACVWTNKGYL
jgi:hypothetical protein